MAEAGSSPAPPLGFPPTIQFPSAPQPSIIRAQQKDEAYLQQLTESCHDAVRRLLGPRRALLWARETALLAELLYFALTTGTGLQTLGEEYCDIVQATGIMGGPPGLLRRGALVLLQAAGPYVAEKSLSQQDEHVRAWQTTRRTATTGVETDDNSRNWGSRLACAARARWQDAEHTARRLSGILAAQCTRFCGPHGLQYARQVRKFLADNGTSLVRLHLALFYIFGRYFQIANRIAGVRFLFTGRLLHHASSYRALGALLLLQLGISTALYAVRRHESGTGGEGVAARSLCDDPPGSMTTTESARLRTHTQRQENTKSKQHVRPAVLLDANGGEVGADDPDGQGIDVSEGVAEPLDVPAAQKCPLCLSRRVVPTSTSCGHVFCWTCITEWALQKPECPLCRSEVTTNGLVVVRHANF